MTTTQIQNIASAIVKLATIVHDNAPAVAEAVAQIRSAK